MTLKEEINILIDEAFRLRERAFYSWPDFDHELSVKEMLDEQACIEECNAAHAELTTIAERISYLLRS